MKATETQKDGLEGSIGRKESSDKPESSLNGSEVGREGGEVLPFSLPR